MNTKAVSDWLQKEYQFEADDADFVAEHLVQEDHGTLIETFSSDDETRAETKTKVQALFGAYYAERDRLANAGRGKSKEGVGKAASVDASPVFVEAEPSPNAIPDYEDGEEISGGKVHEKKGGASKPRKRNVPKPKKKEVVPDDSDSSDKPKYVVTRRPPEELVNTVTDLETMPKYPLSHGMGMTQVTVLNNLIKSIDGNPFDPFKPESGGIKLDDARPCFMTLLARGGICEVKDAIILTKSKKKRWGKKVVPIMPTAQDAIDDYTRRNPDNAKIVGV